MNSKISSKWFFLLVAIIGIVVFSLLMFFFQKIGLSNNVFDYYYTNPVLENLQNINQNPEPNLANNETATEPSSTNSEIIKNENPNTNSVNSAISIIRPKKKDETLLPIRLQIPKINIDGSIQSVGLTEDGAMAPPFGPNGLGWYKFGPYPGEIGSAVIDGHFGTWKNGQGSIFDNLHKLNKGDLIYIKNVDGSLITFVVRELKIFDPEDDAFEVFISNDGGAHLNLITCSGDWISKEKTYTKRLVVFADKLN